MEFPGSRRAQQVLYGVSLSRPSYVISGGCWGYRTPGYEWATWRGRGPMRHRSEACGAPTPSAEVHFGAQALCMAGDRTCSCRCRRTGHHVAGMGRRSSASRSRFHRREAGRSETKRTRPRVEYRWTHADRSSRRRCAPRWLRDWHLGRVDAPPRLYEASHACHQILALTTAGLTRRGGVATIGKLPPKRFHPIDPKPAAATAALRSRRRKSWLWTPAAAQSPTSNKRHSQGTGSRSRRGERGARPSGRIPRSPSARVEGAARAANTARVGRQRAGGGGWRGKPTRGRPTVAPAGGARGVAETSASDFPSAYEGLGDGQGPCQKGCGRPHRHARDATWEAPPLGAGHQATHRAVALRGGGGSRLPDPFGSALRAPRGAPLPPTTYHPTRPGGR